MNFRRLFIYKKIRSIVDDEICKEIQDFINQGEKILDLGCGSGILTGKIEKKFKTEILGMDIADLRVSPVPFQLYDGKKIPYPENYFDTVLISFVLHHTENPVNILKEVKRVGRKIIIIEDIYEGGWGKIRCHIHYFTWNFFCARNPKFNFFTTKEWQEIFNNLNLKLIAQKKFLPKLGFLDPAKREIFILKKEGT